MNSKRYKAILFDMDGVIIDTHIAVTEFWEMIAARAGVTLTSADYAQHIYGCPVAHTLDVIFPQFSPAERTQVFTDIAADERTQQYVPMDGILALLQALRDRGVPTAIVTSGQDFKADTVFAQLGLTALVSTRITADDVQQGKPHPEPYRKAAHRLGVLPQDCLVFEDALSGVQAAVAAGADCIGVRPIDARALLTAGAMTIIEGFTEASVEDNSGEVRLHLNEDIQVSLQAP